MGSKRTKYAFKRTLFDVNPSAPAIYFLKPQITNYNGLPSSSPVKDRRFSISWREFKTAASFFAKERRSRASRKKAYAFAVLKRTKMSCAEKVSLGAPYHAGIAKRSNRKRPDVLASEASGLVPSEVRKVRKSSSPHYFFKQQIKHIFARGYPSGQTMAGASK